MLARDRSARPTALDLSQAANTAHDSSSRGGATISPGWVVTTKWSPPTWDARRRRKFRDCRRRHLCMLAGYRDDGSACIFKKPIAGFAQIYEIRRSLELANCSCAQRHAAAISVPSPWDCCACSIGSVPTNCRRPSRTRSRMERRIRIQYASRSNGGEKRVRHHRRWRLTCPNTYAPKTPSCNPINSRLTIR
jgi:hypothetical protein